MQSECSVDEWNEFSQKHEGNPSLAVDPLYALDDRLIDLIADADGAGTLILSSSSDKK